jgi:predicted peptidase
MRFLQHRALPPLLSMLMLAMLASCGTGRPGMDGKEKFLEREAISDGVRHRYRVFVPVARAHGGKLPIILFLHGSGERGSDNRAQLEAGLGPYLRKHVADFPAIVVFPQVQENGEWIGANVDMALAALDDASREFGGDPQRTYLTGLSMGGYGTWETALKAPTRFAALVPICGALLPPSDERALYVSEVASAADPYAALATKLKHVPIWIFHGAKDNVVLPDDDRKTFAALKAAGADVQYTEFPDADHNSWDATYRHDAMWQWLFAQHSP